MVSQKLVRFYLKLKIEIVRETFLWTLDEVEPDEHELALQQPLLPVLIVQIALLWLAIL